MSNLNFSLHLYAGLLFFYLVMNVSTMPVITEQHYTYMNNIPTWQLAPSHIKFLEQEHDRLRGEHIIGVLSLLAFTVL
jgi:hypothetical protein